MDTVRSATVKKHVKKAAKKLRHLEVRQGENGGHVVMHHYDNSGPMSPMVEGGGYKEPEEHIFGSDQGLEAMAHIGKTLGINSAPAKNETVREPQKGAKR